MIGHFPEGARVRESLVESRAEGLSFDRAWNRAMKDAHLRANGVPLSERRREVAVALVFARKAFRRAYEGVPPTREDILMSALAKAMELMLDDSVDAEPTRIELLDVMGAGDGRS